MGVRPDLSHWRRNINEIENRVLRVEVARCWRKFHNEELNTVYCSPHIFRVIRSKRMKWAGQLSLVRRMRNAYEISV
jgi:hypothetical protein